MREANRPASQLSRCLVDYDPESLSYARRNRARSMLISLGVQALLLTAAVVIPLVASEKLTAVRILTPGVPYYGSPKPAQPEKPAGPRKQPGKIRKFNDKNLVIAPPKIPDQTPVIDDAPDADAGPIAGNRNQGPGNPNAPLVGLPWGDAKNAVVTPILKPPAPRRVQRGGDVQAALLIHRVDPVYPAIPRQMRLEGEVKLHAIIGTDGTVRELEVVSGGPLFVRETLQAVAQWRYRPTLLNGQPVEVETVITVTFKLRRE